MPTEITLAGVIAGLSLGGTGILCGLGMRPRGPIGWMLLVAFGYAAGTCVFMVFAQLMIVLGLPFTAAGLILFALSLAGAWRSRSLPEQTASVPRERWDTAAVALFVVVLLTVGAVGAVAAFDHHLVNWDAWAIWAFKAKVIYLTGTIAGPITKAHNYAFAHPDYPIGMPAVEALYFKASGHYAGRVETQHMHLLPWLMLPSCVIGLALLLRMRIRARIWAPALCAVLAVPAIEAQSITAYMDVPLALALAVSLTFAIAWLEEADSNWLLASAIFAAGAACLKNEGMVTAVAMFAALTLAGRRHWRKLPAGWAIVLLAVVPWRAFVAANSIQADLKSGRLIDPGYMVEKAYRARIAVVKMIERSNHLEHSFLGQRIAWSAIIVVCVCLIATAWPRRSALFAGLSILGSIAALVSAYWISDPIRVIDRIDSSLSRVILTPLLLIVCGAVALSSQQDQEPAQLEGRHGPPDS
jgi:hypothetical protein